MLKLHLEEPLPGIPGDRRLTESVIAKCVYLSSVLPDEIQNDDLGADLEIVPEFFGITAGDCGVLLRLLPGNGVIPGFSLYSKDRQYLEHEPIIVKSMRSRFGENSAEAAQRFGADFAAPLVRSLIAGFRKGIALEMHAQNTLVQLRSDARSSTGYCTGNACPEYTGPTSKRCSDTTCVRKGYGRHRSLQ
jgi:hypothetical protein